MIHLNVSLNNIAKLSKAMKWLKIKLSLSCQICPVIDRHNFIKSCFSADIVLFSCSKLFLMITQMLISRMEFCM